MLRHLRNAPTAGLLVASAAAAQSPPGVRPTPPVARPQAQAAPVGRQHSVWNEIMTTRKFQPCMPVIPRNTYKDNTGKGALTEGPPGAIFGEGPRLKTFLSRYHG